MCQYTAEMTRQADRRLNVFYAYGEVMWQLQLLEMTYWTILSLKKIPESDDFDQAWERTEGWMKGTLGKLIHLADLPEALDRDSKVVRDMRNNLAHEFLRERVMLLDDDDLYDKALEDLSSTLHWIEDLQKDLGNYLREELNFDPDEEHLTENDLKKIFADVEGEAP